ncbi:piggyBac transposable element-derived protein 4 [Trichonephila clavipes]|uniref:PiggyBac transposable element-derived protein 4 n=1 Tax=Trichonephila clavipes TaxID=2585209 RepID=A0A8X6VAN0_TRICX|nr:piggyBac transposable element-derived protein 4 [Trichonephila clavipes]
MIVQFRNEKVGNHGSIPIAIDCNIVAFIVFEEGYHQPIKRTKHFILWQVDKRNRSLDQLIFRIALACQLIDRYSTRKRKGRPANFQAKKCVVPDDMRLASLGKHMPNIVFIYRRYRKCSRKGQEKRTRYMRASLVYADKPQTLDHLEDNIRRVIADIRPQMLEKFIENWTSRLDYIRASRGSPMPEIIFKM